MNDYLEIRLERRLISGMPVIVIQYRTKSLSIVMTHINGMPEPIIDFGSWSEWIDVPQVELPSKPLDVNESAAQTDKKHFAY